MFAVSFLRMRNVVVLATLVFMFLGMEALLLSVVYIPEACSATVPVTQIFHKQVSSFAEGSSLPIEVAIKDPVGVTGVRCYFRFDSSVPFVYSEMVGTRNNVFTTKLPIAIATVQKIEYLFLVVNGQKQAILSQIFTLNKKNSGKVQSTDGQSLVPKQYQLKSEVVGADTAIKFFLQPANVDISLVPQKDHYGVLAGLYSREQLDSEVVAGYFGAFRLDPKKGMIAVKGSIVTRSALALSSSQEKSTVAKATVTDTQATVTDTQALVVNIGGSSWTGLFWRSNDYENTVTPITATVTQNADKVTITTSMEGLGHYLVGDIYVTGHMLLYDAYDGEDWSTHYGPVTDLYIKIADYVVPPPDVCTLPDECTRPDECLIPYPVLDICYTPLPDICNVPLPDECVHWPLNIIELKRSTNEKVPIGAISLLLL